jgi:serralysin
MPSILNLSPETRVNTTTTGFQEYSHVAALADGGWVVAWASHQQDGDDFGIYLQRYDSRGQPVGEETAVNTFTAGLQFNARVASLQDGGWVVTWVSDGQDGSSFGIYALRYDAWGIPAGPETQVNTATAGVQNLNDVVPLLDGGYVVTWDSRVQFDSVPRIFAQIYDADNLPVGNEIPLNTTTLGNQYAPRVAASADGGFIVAWVGTGQGGDNDRIFSQRFDASGAPLGPEVRVNTTTAGSQKYPSITTLSDGGYVIAWDGNGPGDGFGVFLQRYSADGNTIGGEILVNTTLAGVQAGASFTALNDGGFVVSWFSPQKDGSGYAACAQRFDDDGQKIGDEMQINTTQKADQHLPSVAALPDGGFVMTWTSRDQDGSGAGIYQRAFSGATSGAGSQQVFGGAGADVLDGGAGPDRMFGGGGNDTYVVDNLGDRVRETANGIDTGGVDLVQSSVSYTLGAFVETLTLTGSVSINGTGNSLANTITGNALANTLDGRGGADIMAGGAGNDTYIVDNTGDTAVETAAGNGTDLVRSSVTFTLGNFVENLTLTGSGAIEGIGNALANTIIGNGSSNILNGSTGADIMVGGAGNDTYIVDNVGDAVFEPLGQGSDLVQSSVTYTLAADVEHLTLTGAAAINGTGNVLDNIITGNDANNILTGLEGADVLLGGAGVDRMTGGDGNDTYYVGTAGDLVVEGLNQGTFDQVFSTISYTMTANVEYLMLLGGSPINGSGNTLANIIQGNNAANVLNGGVGADHMLGAQANDTYVVDNAGDTTVEYFDQGTDTVNASISFTLADNVENLTLTGSGANAGTGNDLANRIIGNGAANIIDGKAGADMLTGGLGADIFVFSRADIADTITDFSAPPDTIRLSSAAFGGFLTIGAAVTLVSGATPMATLATPTILYDTDDGRLLADLDGAGAMFVAFHFATLTGAPVITAADFQVVA